MVFKLVESAQARWWAVNAPHLFVERPEAQGLNGRNKRAYDVS